MAVRSVILFIGVYFGFGKAADPEYAKLGGTITLVPTFTGKMDEILWKHNGDKVVEFDGRQNKEFSSFVGRTILDVVTGELMISALTAEDSGLYRLEAHINNHLQYSNHEVQVIAEVAQPTIICEINDTKTASMATLQCNADRQDQQSPITYNWERLEDTLHGSVSSDQKLSIAVKDRHDEAVFQCSVSNHVSKKQAQFQVKNCFTEESSSTALAVGLSMLFLIILLIVLGLLLYYKRNRKAKPNGNKQDDVDDPLMQGRQDDWNGHTTQENINETEENVHKATLPSKQALPQQAQSEEKNVRNIHLTPGTDRDSYHGNKSEECEEENKDVAARQKMKSSATQIQTETSPDSPSSPTDGHLNGITSDTVAVSKSTDPSQPDLNQSEQAQDLSQQVKILVQSQTKPTDTSPLKLTSDTHPPALNSTQPSAECNTSAQPSSPQVSLQSDQNALQPIPEHETVPDQKLAESVEVSLPDQTSGVAAGESVTKEPTDQAVPEWECEEEHKDGAARQKMKSSAGMEAGDVGEKKPEGRDDTSLGMGRSMETEDAENKKSAEDVGNMEQPSIKEEKVGRDESVEKNPCTGEMANVASLVDAVGTDVKNANIEQDVKKDRGGIKVDSQREEAGSDEQGETEHQKQPDTDKTGQNCLLESPSNPTQHESEPEAIKNMLETNTESKSEAPAEGHQAENYESFSTFPGGEEGDEDGLNDTEKGMETWDGKTEQKTNDGGIVEDVMDQNGEEAFVKAPDAVAVSKPAELSQVQPDPNDSKAERDVDPCQQPKSSSSSSTSPGELVGSDGSKEAEDGMKAGDVGEKKTEGGGDTSLGMDRSMEAEDAENKKSTEDVGNMEQLSSKEEKVGTDESAEKDPYHSFTVWLEEDKENYVIKDEDYIKVNSQMEEAGSDEQGDKTEEKDKGTEQGETNSKLEHWKDTDELQGRKH